MFSKRLRLLVSKAILMVMVFASLAPTLSHAFANKTGPKNVWQEICTLQGTKRIAAGFTLNNALADINAGTASRESNPNSMPTAMHFEHCPFCLNHATAAAFPAVDNTSIVLLDTGKFYLQTYYLAPVLTALLLSDHLSRAPPLEIE
ncbi:MAG: DUF2946 domain-containing protein [Bacteroidia bacterium]|nr:DUF2946 domain-containing protein [Methylotenera sp.]